MKIQTVSALNIFVYLHIFAYYYVYKKQYTMHNVFV